MALPTYTAQQFITNALKMVGFLGTGQTLEAADAADGLQAFNELLDAWGTQRLTMRYLLRTAKVLASGTASYTIGVGGSINIPQPIEIEYATLLYSDGITEVPIDVFSDQAWASIAQKGMTGSIVRGIYFDHRWNAGLATITPWPTPTDSTTSLVLYTPQALTEFATLTTAYTLPPGHPMLYRYNLAVELAVWHGVPVPDHVAAKAIETLADVKRVNQRPMVLSMDPALTGGGHYSIETDSKR